jgi:hypothetical protein
VTESCSGQVLGDATDADTDAKAADKSNPLMSPFQGDAKMEYSNLVGQTLVLSSLADRRKQLFYNYCMEALQTVKGEIPFEVILQRKLVGYPYITR